MAPDHAVGQPQGEDQQPADADDRPGDPHVADHPRQPQEPQQPEEPDVFGGVRQQDPVGRRSRRGSTPGSRRRSGGGSTAASPAPSRASGRTPAGRPSRSARIRPGECILLGGRQRPGVLRTISAAIRPVTSRIRTRTRFSRTATPGGPGRSPGGGRRPSPATRCGPAGPGADLPDGRGDPVLPRPVLVAGLPLPAWVRRSRSSRKSFRNLTS